MCEKLACFEAGWEARKACRLSRRLEGSAAFSSNRELCHRTHLLRHSTPYLTNTSTAVILYKVTVAGAVRQPRVGHLHAVGALMHDENNELTCGTVIDVGGVQVWSMDKGLCVPVRGSGRWQPSRL